MTSRPPLPLADDLFLVAWDVTISGQPRLHPHSIGLALSGALLAELVFAGRLAVREERLTVTSPAPVPDPLAASVLAELVAHPQHTTIPTWLAYLETQAVTKVADRLIAAGLLVREQPRLLRHRPSRYKYADRTVYGRAAWPPERLRGSLLAHRPVAEQDMMLLALADGCGLTPTLLNDPAVRRTAEEYLAAVLRALPAPLTAIARQVRSSVGDAVLTYRTHRF
ncbi:GOLPH3/VPS74 family protein [Nonomuraea typhae]|uniref:GOLPH3/VPS74 family protein n=1 Tax=Nonomuraea typhae TaxID=2603600 RepID=UPI0012F74D03|nr:GPP34 family phosphoprotein [Nonomuraea typhae]